MKTIWVLIEDNGTTVNAVLAGEALRKAGEESGQNVVVGICSKDGVFAPFSQTPIPDDVCIMVGNVQPQNSLIGLPLTKTTIEEVLQNAPAILNKTGLNSGSYRSVKNIVAVTSCPTGIAHTFMAAEGLEQGGKALGYNIKVETQGSVGAGNPLTLEEIAAADVVIIAADREVDRERFSGKRVYSSGTKLAITNGQEYIKKALAEATVQNSGGLNTASSSGSQENKAGPYKHLMTGVSFMLPFVVAGGLLIAIAFALGGIHAGDKKGTLAQVLMIIGGQGGFALMVPVLSGYIAFSIADRPGLAPGMIGGLMCNILNAGFLGGIFSGFVAGYGTMLINKATPLPKNLAGLKPVLILPLLGTLLTGLIMFYVVGAPAASLNEFLKEWLRGLQGTNSLILGLILGGMMAVDLGGPINKAAYAFSTLMLQSGSGLPMAAVMAAGMTAPLAAGLATKVFKNRFTHDEREAGNAAFVLGLAFVSEGAIPFAAKDPFRVIPSFIIGSAVAGAMSMYSGVQLMVPHGGIFVLPIPYAVTGLSKYALSIVAGTVVSCLLLGILKKPITKN